MRGLPRYFGLFVTEKIPITVSRRAPDKEARPKKGILDACVLGQ